jgi:predicted nucleic acid-binding Zn ribbon protein
MNDEHSHCEICGRTTPLGEFVCDSAECAEKKAEIQKMKKRTVYMTLALIIVGWLFLKFL